MVTSTVYTGVGTVIQQLPDFAKVADLVSRPADLFLAVVCSFHITACQTCDNMLQAFAITSSAPKLSLTVYQPDMGIAS